MESEIDTEFVQKKDLPEFSEESQCRIEYSKLERVERCLRKPCWESEMRLLDNR